MWQQFNFYCSESLLRLHPNSEFYDRCYSFKRKLLPILDEHNAEDFLILDEGRFFLLRVELDPKTARTLREAFDRLVDESSDFDKVTVESWSPEEDARTRILGARERAVQMGVSLEDIPEGGWRIETRYRGQWIAEPDDLNMKIEKFSRFMSKVVGKFTRAYLEELPQRVDDRWLLSVFIHLLLHSISEQRFERQTREFPWI